MPLSFRYAISSPHACRIGSPETPEGGPVSDGALRRGASEAVCDVIEKSHLKSKRAPSAIASLLCGACEC